VPYRVSVDRAAEKDIDRLPKTAREKVLDAIDEVLKVNPRGPRCEPLEGKLR